MPRSVKGAVAALKAPLEPAKKHPIATAVVVLVVILIAFRFRSQIMGALSKLPLISTGAAKLSGEG